MAAPVTSDRRRVSADSSAPIDQRIIAATLRCIALGGVAGLTLDDVAREAGCGRATVYRTFPSGKDGVIRAAAGAELQRFVADVGTYLDAAESLEDLLAGALSGAARFVAASAPLRYMAVNEPAIILSHVAFDHSPVIFDAAYLLLAPRLTRFMEPSQVPILSEWVARLGLSYLALPFPGVDLTDPTVARRLVVTFVLPGLPAPGPALDLTTLTTPTNPHLTSLSRS